MLTESGSSWKIGSKNPEKYKEKLFNPERLELHERLFQDVTLPSLLNQSQPLNERNYTHLIITSDQLPEKNVRNLQEIIAPYPWAKVVQVPSNGSQSKLIGNVMYQELSKFEEEVCYSTTRLDDDDALGYDFFEELNKYISPMYAGNFISFGKGYAGVYNDNTGKMETFHEYYYPKIALGMTYINIYNPVTDSFQESEISVFFRGNHVNADIQSPTLIDSRKPLFIRTLHAESDTRGNQKKIDKIKSGKVANPIDVCKEFPFLMTNDGESIISEDVYNN